MHKFILFIKDFRIYKKKELLDAAASLSTKRFFLLATSVFIAVVCGFILLAKVNAAFMVSVPISGGKITEGIVGVPTLVNPVSALSDADKDMVSLVYSGLMRKDQNGDFIPDLAESYPEISPDGKTYTFTLKKNAKFHNGKKISADDIIFTIEKIKDPIVKSPRRLAWEGVSVSKIDEHTVVFTLTQPYISFLDNTTIGILPSSIWKNVNISEFNISPLNTKAIGSGPYKVINVIKNNDGIPEKYELERFNNFALGKPLIKKINIVSFANEKDLVKALENGSINQAGGISPENALTLKKDKFGISTSTLPRIFGVFYNSNNNKIFNDSNVTKAIDLAIDRQEIVDSVLSGYGSVIHNPVPGRILSDDQIEKFQKANIEEANSILDKAGWQKGEDGIRTKGATSAKTITKKVNGKKVTEQVKATPGQRLSFSLTTGETTELKQAASIIKDQLALIGIEVDIKKVYETGQLNQVIRARDYEALFFGQVINHESDLYSFWHSSQKSDPGLNIAMYTNKKVDTILESVQKTLSFEDRAEKYQTLSEEFNSNLPASLIYSPLYVYVTSPTLYNVQLDNITTPSDRFLYVYKWAADTDRVWKIFTK